MKAKPIYLMYLAIVCEMMFFSGCATMDAVTGKAELEKKIANLEQQLSASNAEKNKLRDTVANLEQQLSAEKAKYASDIEGLQKKLEITKVKGMPVIFFGGDIAYEVAVEGYKDYRAGLRYRALRDENFKTALEQFEAGKGGDAIILSTLKEMDTSGDKLIDPSEARGFRKSEEAKYTSKSGNITNP